MMGRKKQLILEHELTLEAIYKLIPYQYQDHRVTDLEERVKRSVKKLVDKICPQMKDTNTVEMRLRALECDGHDWNYFDDGNTYSYEFPSYTRQCKKCKKVECIDRLTYLQGMIDYSKAMVKKYTKELKDQKEFGNKID